LFSSEAFARFVLAHRPLVASLLVALTLLAAAGIFDPIRGVPRIRIDPSLNEMLPADDSARRFYEELLERFGSDDVVFVVLQSPDLFTPDGLETLVRATDALKSAVGVHHVEGLATALRLRRQDDDLDISGFLDSVPTTQGAADRLRDDVLADPLRAGSFVSGDGHATGILVTFQPIPEDQFIAQNLDLGVLERARASAPGMKVFMAGTPHIKAEVGRLMTSELALMLPTVFLLMSALSCGFFRSLRLGLVPIAAVALGLVWTLGVMGWVGHDLNIVTTLIPPLVLALGFAYATHVVASAAVDAGEGPPDPSEPHGSAQSASRDVERALARVAFPVAFTALTTAAGFLSLTTNDLAVIRGFGGFAAVSTAATLLAALTLVPLLLSGRQRRARAPRSAPSRLAGFFEALADFDIRHANRILIATLLVALAALWGATRIEVNLPVIENFPPDAEIRLAYTEVDRLFGGANQFYVMLRAENPGDFERPDWLQQVARLQEWLLTQPEIGGTTSVVQYLEVLNEALGPEETPTRRLPATANGVAQLLLFGGNEELDVMIDRAHQVITILVRSTATETREFDLLAKRIDARLEELPEGISGHTTGNAILLTRAANRISRGQAISLLWAGGMIGLLLIGYFRSIGLGLLALVPNAVPVVLYFGLLGWTGTTLNNSTALMGSIVLGIAVDDTLHLLVEYRRGLRASGDAAQALRSALIHVGRAISCTTMAICLGLLVVGASALRNQAEFGLLGAATLAIAWLVDVMFTPALCWRLIRRA
jgi:predicted RND superfamily exporter protein